jgi:ATP-dependent helicase/nuclease subunit A
LARTGFYDCLEVLDLLSLLQLLDNPLQDIPALAVLRSPLVGLTLADLAEIRLALPKAPFWTALMRWHNSRGRPSDSKPSDADGVSGCINGELDPKRKIETFLVRFSHWRRMAQQTSLSECLETVLHETDYDSWLMTQPNGLQRQANVQRLIGVARQFEQFQRQGLFRFLKYIEAQKSSRSEPETVALPTQDAVRFMSIHQSKGLEFPLVVVADLGKKFNTADLRAEVILDEAYGLCPQVKPPTTGKRYPSLAHWLGSRRQLQELLGEELRLLYVATTRARDSLLLTGTITKSKLAKAWGATPRATASAPGNARSYLDWLGQWFQTTIAPGTELPVQGQTDLLRWFFHTSSTLAQREQAGLKVQPLASVTAGSDRAAAQELERRFSWKYPFVDATRQPAKTSVTALRRQAAAERDEAVFLSPEPAGSGPARATRAPGDLDSAEKGKAHHLFLQFVSLEGTGGLDWFRSEAERLVESGRLTPEQGRSLVLADLADFWNSELGCRIRERARFVHRELGFTARFSPEQLVPFGAQFRGEGIGSEFVLVQGVADLVVISPQEIWLLDFKTDHVNQRDLNARVAVYRPQIELYALALSGIYRRPVTQSWLHFIGLRQSLAVPVKESCRI